MRLGSSRATLAAMPIAHLALAATLAVAAHHPLPAVSVARPPALTAGQVSSVTARATAGRQRTVATVALVALSADRRLGATDVRLATVRIKPLAPHRRLLLHLRLQVPGTAPAGRFRLLVCRTPVGAHARACTASAGLVSVRAGPANAPAPPVPQPPQPTPAPTPGGGPTPVPPFGDGVFQADIPASLPGLTPDPRTVTPHLDDAHAASATITPGGGGALSTTAADGTKYALDVPPGAVTSDTAITLTPLTGVDGLGMSGGLVGGVQLAPDGLELLAPATLTITPAAGTPTTGLTAFAYHGSGDDLGLVPLDPGDALQLYHFSGGGIGSATPADVAAQAAHPPLTTTDQFRQEAARLYMAGDRAGLQTLFETYFDQVVRPKLEAALADDSLAQGAIDEALGAIIQMERLGFDVGATADVVDGYEIQILKNAYARSYARCVVNHAPEEASRMLTILQQLTQRGAGEDVDSDKVWQCAQFKLDLRLHFDWPTFYGTFLDLQALGAQLTYDVGKAGLTGTVPLVVAGSSFTNTLCGPSDPPGSATVTAPGFATLRLAQPIIETKVGAHTIVTYGPPQISLELNRGAVRFTAVGCPYSDEGFELYRQAWQFVYPELELAGADGPVTFGPADWTYHGGADYAVTNLVPRSGRGDNGDVQLTLHHTPAG